MPFLPDRVFTRPLLGRGAYIWATLRLGIALVSWLMSGLTEPFSLAVTGRAAAWIAAVAAILGVLELRRRNEHLLLANLGFGARTLTALAAAPAVLGEIALAAWHTSDAARG